MIPKTMQTCIYIYMKLFDMRQTESEALSVLEGVNMSGKALTKALGDTKGITIGWGVDFSSDELESPPCHPF